MRVAEEGCLEKDGNFGDWIHGVGGSVHLVPYLKLRYFTHWSMGPHHRRRLFWAVFRLGDFHWVGCLHWIIIERSMWLDHVRPD